MVEIDFAGAEDLRALEALEKKCFSQPWSKDAILSDILHPMTTYLVIRETGEVRGYGGYWKVGGEGHITNIAIDPRWRGKGLGKALLLGLMDKGREEGLTAMTLEVRPSNHKALSLYKKAGFQYAGSRKDYYADPREDAWIFWKEEL